MNVVERRLDQPEAVGGRAMDGAEVGVVGLVAGVGRQAVLPGGQGMNDPRVSKPFDANARLTGRW